MNIWDIVILLMIAAAAVVAFRSIRKSARKGCDGCCATCRRACGGR